MAHVGALLGGVNAAMHAQRISPAQAMTAQRCSQGSSTFAGQTVSLRADRRSLRVDRAATLQASLQQIFPELLYTRAYPPRWHQRLSACACALITRHAGHPVTAVKIFYQGVGATSHGGLSPERPHPA